MRRTLLTRISRWFAVLVFLGIGWPAAAQRRYENVEPQMFRMRFSGGSIGFYAEGSDEQTSYQSGISSSYQRLFEGPLIGLGVEGSIYHPDLMQFSLSGDLAVGWTQEKTTTAGTSLNRSDTDYLGNISGTAVLLANKPYRTGLFVTGTHSFHEYDFFNRVMVDSLRYGLNSGYSEGPVPFHISVSRYDEDASGLGYFSTLRQTTLYLDAHNDRSSGATSLSYTFDNFDRSYGAATMSGIQHSIGISDRETFGSRKDIEWRNSMALSKRELTDAPSDTLTAGSHLVIEHRPNLSSFFDADYLRDKTDLAVSENNDASAAVQHRLFASLTSGLRFQFSRNTSSRSGGDFESTQYTGTWSESYTKLLTASSRLSIGGSFGRSHTDQQSSAAIQIIGEAHTFNAGGPFLDSFFLNLINVNQVAPIEVWNQARTIRYTRDVDYTVSVVGAQTLLRLIDPNPSGLTRDTQLAVDYEAVPQGTGSIEGQFSDAQIRLDLMDGMWGIYGRFNSSDYSASEGIVVQNVNSFTCGVDFFRKWLRAGAEYQIYDATFASYTAVRLYQTLSFTPDEVSSLNITFSEGASDYKTSRRTEQYLSCVSRYHRGPTAHLGLDFEAGISQRFGPGMDQTLAAVRPSISYNIGQLSVKAGYDFFYQQSESTEERMKHMFSIRVRRSF